MSADAGTYEWLRREQKRTRHLRQRTDRLGAEARDRLARELARRLRKP